MLPHMLRQARSALLLLLESAQCRWSQRAVAWSDKAVGSKSSPSSWSFEANREQTRALVWIASLAAVAWLQWSLDRPKVECGGISNWFKRDHKDKEDKESKTGEKKTHKSNLSNSMTSADLAPRPLVISGPSGAGKSTLLKKIFMELSDEIGFSVSHTTRQPRPYETNGKQYWFVSDQEFQQMIAQDAFIEYTHYSGNWYGTSIAAVKSVVDSGKTCILDIDAEGVRSMKKTDLNARYIFVMPPSVEELERRLRGRGTETEESIHARLEASKAELEFAALPNSYDIVIVNDDLDAAHKKLRNYIYRSLGKTPPTPIPSSVGSSSSHAAGSPSLSGSMKTSSSLTMGSSLSDRPPLVQTTSSQSIKSVSSIGGGGGADVSINGASNSAPVSPLPQASPMAPPSPSQIPASAAVAAETMSSLSAALPPLPSSSLASSSSAASSSASSAASSLSSSPLASAPVSSNETPSVHVSSALTDPADTSASHSVAAAPESKSQTQDAVSSVDFALEDNGAAAAQSR